MEFILLKENRKQSSALKRKVFLISKNCLTRNFRTVAALERNEATEKLAIAECKNCCYRCRQRWFAVDLRYEVTAQRLSITKCKYFIPRRPQRNANITTMIELFYKNEDLKLGRSDGCKFRTW